MSAIIGKTPPGGFIVKFIKNVLRVIVTLAALCAFALGFLYFYLPRAEFDFARETADDASRICLVSNAQLYLDVQEGSPEHHAIIDAYNAHEPLAQGYEVKYDDDWCATFVSFCAIEAKLTDNIPTECGCERQIGLWQKLGQWEETDTYLPLPGDIIYFVLKGDVSEDCTAWSDHVGIVVGTNKDRIKVIEGNNGGAVRYRYIKIDDPTIRGYALPDYASKT
jgi:hypothetical protein